MVDHLPRMLMTLPGVVQYLGQPELSATTITNRVNTCFESFKLLSNFGSTQDIIKNCEFILNYMLYFGRLIS